MKAIQVTRFGGPEVLTLTELYRDRPGLPQPPYVPGLEVASTIRALGDGVTSLTIGQRVVALSNQGTGGYATVYVADVDRVIPADIDPALAVAVVPNAIMAHVALTRVARMAPGESILIHGALGALSAAFPGIARQIGAGRVVGTVRSERTAAAAASKLPYDVIVDSAHLPDEKFDVIIDPVGGELRTLDRLAPFGRLLLVGNASGDWQHSIPSNPIWFGNLVVAGFNAGGYLPAHPDTIRPAAEAALSAVPAGLADTEIELLPLADAATAHDRMQNHSANGRLVLTTA
jgi:NADPH:quinone reductase